MLSLYKWDNAAGTMRTVLQGMPDAGESGGIRKRTGVREKVVTLGQKSA